MTEIPHIHAPWEPCPYTARSIKLWWLATDDDLRRACMRLLLEFPRLAVFPEEFEGVRN